MKHRQWLLIGLLFLTSVAPCFAKAWGNIFPLKTTRAEVLKLLGNSRENWAMEGESFEVEANSVNIRWVRADCYDKDVVNKDQLANFTNSDLLVSQVSVIPKVPLTHKVIEEEEASFQITDSNAMAGLETKMKLIDKSLIFYTTDCLGQGNDKVCLYLTRNGFGYTSSNKGVTGLYYYPSSQELADWKEKRRPCSSK